MRLYVLIVQTMFWYGNYGSVAVGTVVCWWRKKEKRRRCLWIVFVISSIRIRNSTNGIGRKHDHRVARFAKCNILSLLVTCCRFGKLICSAFLDSWIMQILPFGAPGMRGNAVIQVWRAIRQTVQSNSTSYLIRFKTLDFLWFWI